MLRSTLHSLALALTLAACADRPVDLSLEDESGSDSDAPAPGEALSSCMDEDDCFDDWCVHPTDEPGFCTFACSSAAQCPDASGGATASATCLLVAGDQVCALDCATGSCPSGMRCEQIEAGNGTPRSICF